MKKYMLVLFSYADLKKITEHIKKKLKAGDKLLVRAVMLEEVPKLAEHLISNIGMLGEKVVNDLEDSVVEMYHDNAENYLKNLEKIAAENNFELDKKLLESSKLAALKEEIKSSDLSALIINFSHNEYVSNQIKEKEIKAWLKKVELPKNIFYDGKREK